MNCRGHRSMPAPETNEMKMSLPTDVNQAPEVADAVGAISAAIAVSDFRRAHAIADAAIAGGGAHPVLFTARAIWLEQQGRNEEALADFETAVSLAPGNHITLNAVGLCLTRLQRLDEAVAAFDEAIRINPTFSPSYHRKGIALGLAGDLAAARRAHEQAVRLNPRDSEALANLASFAARNGDTKKAADYAARALKLDPRNPTALAALALVANLEGRYDEAERLARTLLEGPGLPQRARAVAFGQLADALDGQDRTDEAFSSYSSENEILQRLSEPQFGALRSVTQFARDLSDHIQATPLEEWRTVAKQGLSPHRHVFVLGFYRSGTTLLGQVLASHPDVATLEERDHLLGPASHFLSDRAGLAQLLALGDDELASEREAYWRKIRQSGVNLEGMTLVDKQPLNSMKLPLLARLFPDAAIVLAVRDPRDVVWSCFRRHFEINNAAMFDLLTLEKAATFYDSVMTLVELCRPMFAKPFLTLRYEDMIADFDGRIGALCQSLDIPFDPKMREFHARTGARDIRSPSASQVTRELYSEGAGQWLRYHQHLAPVLPILAPWIDKFGYSQE
jgi:Flp pilus assembly protein TadD